jgi:hypothetical protein
MKRIIPTTVVLLAFGAGQAMAACPTTGTATAANISALVSGKYACAMRGDEQWNLLHQGTGFGPANLQDYKKGPSDPVDPSEVVGTYTIVAGSGGSPDTIRYDYGGGGAYTFVVTPNASTAGTYTYCDTATSGTTAVTISPGHC